MRPILTVNLSAIRTNYNMLKARHAAGNIASVVKADAYGLGAKEVANALWQEGCRNFFVATLEEAIELRASLPDGFIGVFLGLFSGEEVEYAKYNITPTLNDVSQVESFLKSDSFANDTQMVIHVDTGMTRLGLSESELAKVSLKLKTLHPKLLISHLACANTAQHPKNEEQLSRFRTALAYLDNAQASLANSAGVFLPQEYHFDMARTGCALYGINPAGGKNPMQQVVNLSAPIVQIRILDRDETIGYDATAKMKKSSHLAIAGLGYADGYSRLLGNIGHAYIAGYKVPVTGRVSMDLVALDVSDIPENILANINSAEFINNQQTVDDIAEACSTIGYEILTRIGNRVKREYI